MRTPRFSRRAVQGMSGLNKGMRNSQGIFVAAVLYAGCSTCWAEPFKEVGPALFRSGEIQLDAKARVVTFPGKVNMGEGALEYALVTPAGSVHESLLVTEVDLVDLHTAFLLLGLKGQEGAGSSGQGTLNARELESSAELAGALVRVYLRWESGGAKKRAALSDWIQYKPEGKAAREGPWSYTGSYFSGNQFAAVAEGAVVCLVTNAAALVNNPRKGHRDDRAWEVNTGSVPPVGTAVTIEIEVPRIEKPTP